MEAAAEPAAEKRMSTSQQVSEEIAAPPAVASPYIISLPEAQRQFTLYYGTNTIGRCTPDLADPAFISIDNENTALSRLHATITIAPNMDAWLRDLGSTNGTHLSIREGEGVPLEAHCFYQLSSGALITLGDIGVVFFDTSSVAVPSGGSSSPAAVAALARKSASVINPARSGPDFTINSQSAGVMSGASLASPNSRASGGVGGSSNMVGGGDTTSKQQQQGAAPAPSPTNNVSRRPYLDDDSDTSLPQPPQPLPNRKAAQQLSFMDDESELMHPPKGLPNMGSNTLGDMLMGGGGASGSEAANNTSSKADNLAKTSTLGAATETAASPKGRASKASEASPKTPTAPAPTPSKKAPAAKRGRFKGLVEDEDDASTAEPAAPPPAPAVEEGQAATKKTRAEAPTTAKGKKAAAAATPKASAAVPKPAAAAASSTTPDAASLAPTLDEYRSKLGSYVWPDSQKLNVCLSGMDTTDREKVANRIRLMGGNVLEDWSDRCTLLVVKDSPAARTPKFLNALAKGVLIVTSRFFTDQQSGGNISRLLEFVPELTHNGSIVSAPDVVDVILYHQHMKAQNLCPTGALSHMMFIIADVPQRIRGTVGDVITGCGGKVAKNKRDEAKAAATNMRLVTLGSDDADKLYDAIVTGSSSRFGL